MHPAVCDPVSRLSYDGRLRAHEDVTAARRLDGVAPGVRVLTVDHDGNSTDSPEEADAIVAEIGAPARHPVDRRARHHRRSAQQHVLVVTPYNAQVVTLRRRLDAAGLTDVEVGTVDKFQGRQAPVVFVSMAASSADDAPRGVSFLFNRNRLERRGQPSQVHGDHRPVGAADRLPAVDARPTDRTRRVSVPRHRVIHRRSDHIADRDARGDRRRSIRQLRSRRPRRAAASTTRAATAGRPARWCGPAPTTRSPRCCAACRDAGVLRHGAGRADVAGGGHGPRARRRPAVHRTALRTSARSTPSSDGCTSAPEPRLRRFNERPPTPGWCSAWTSPHGTPRRSAEWRRRTRAGCGPCATATWASRSSASTWRCPTAHWCKRHSEVRRDNTGYDLASLFVGAEGTLGVITGLDVRLHPVPAHRVTAIAGSTTSPT